MALTSITTQYSNSHYDIIDEESLISKELNNPLFNSQKNIFLLPQSQHPSLHFVTGYILV